MEEKYIKLLDAKEKELTSLKSKNFKTEQDLSNALEALKNIANDILDTDIYSYGSMSVTRINSIIMSTKKEFDRLVYIEEKSEEYRSQVINLRRKLKAIIEECDKNVQRAKEVAMNTLNNKNKMVTDQWGFIEASLKAYPQAERLINDVCKLATFAIKETRIPESRQLSTRIDFIDRVEANVQDCYATCKTIFRHDEQESARQNPKQYSYDVLTNFYLGMNKDLENLNELSSRLKKLNDINPYYYGAGESSNPNVSRVMQIICKLVSTIESYSNLVYKVCNKANFARPENSILYRNGRGNYNYGSKKDRSTHGDYAHGHYVSGGI